MQIIRAHLIPETLTWADLVTRTETGLEVTFTSLQGLPWTCAPHLSCCLGVCMVPDLAEVEWCFRWPRE